MDTVGEGEGRTNGESSLDIRRRRWQPTPVFLPESQGRGSLVGCRLWGRTESDTTEVTWQQRQQCQVKNRIFEMKPGSLHLTYSLVIFMHIKVKEVLSLILSLHSFHLPLASQACSVTGVTWTCRMPVLPAVAGLERC